MSSATASAPVAAPAATATADPAMTDEVPRSNDPRGSCLCPQGLHSAMMNVLWWAPQLNNPYLIFKMYSFIGIIVASAMTMVVSTFYDRIVSILGALSTFLSILVAASIILIVWF